MDCYIDRSIPKRLFDLFSKQALVSDLFQRPGLKTISAGLNNLDPALISEGSQFALDVVSLPERKLRASRPDDKQFTPPAGTCFV
jgi:hypothetical protein